ncbi:MAG: AAA family ATPase [Verrucomicrobia bacterium]|nr:AAA family ATPase [Verrucomicrobiota bacterium]
MVEDVASRLSLSARDKTLNADALLREAEDAVHSLRHCVGANQLPKICDAFELLAAPIPAPREVVCGLLHQGSKLSISGGSKAFKTWVLTDLALPVGFKKLWIGLVTNPGRVLYVNLELQEWSFQKRIEAVARAKGIAVSAGHLDRWNLRGHSADYRTLLPKIKAGARECGYVLVVLDPIYKLYGSETDENSAGDVAGLLNAIEDLTTTTGAAVAFGAHFSKGNQSAKEAIDRVSGSGVFARDPDSLLVMTRHEEEGAFAVEATLRNFPAINPFVVRWEYPLMRRDDTLDPAKLKQLRGRKREHGHA